MENKIINFIKGMWEQTLTPTIKSSWEKSRKNTEDLIQAIQEKEVTEEVAVTNFDEAINPLVEAQNATTEAVKSIPVVSIPELDISTLEDKLDALKKSFDNKDLTVNIGKTEIDTKSVVKAIEKLEKNLPKMEKQVVIDYTLMFDEMMKIMERPRDHSKMIETQELIKKLSKTEDIAVLAEYLQQLIDKPYPEMPSFEFNKEGRLKVEVDRAGGGGGGGLTSIQEEYLKEISENTAFKELSNGVIIGSIAKGTGVPMTLSTNGVKGSYTLVMTAGHTFANGDNLLLAYTNINFIAKVLNVATNTLTLDTPLDFAYPTVGTVVFEVVTNLNVDGSATPQIFESRVGVNSNINIAVTEVRFNILDNAAMDDSLFGGITALTRGIVCRVVRADGTYRNFFNAKSNGDMALLVDNTNYSTKAPSGSYSVSFQWKIKDSNGVVVELNPGDAFQIIVQDNLTALISFNAVLIGHTSNL